MTKEVLQKSDIIKQEVLELKATARTASGKEASNSVRKNSQIPCILYGEKTKNVMLSTNLKEFLSLYNKGNIEAKLFNLDIDGKTNRSIVREVQLHPVTDVPLHIDFQRVSSKDLLKVPLLIKFTEKELCVGIKRGGVLNIIVRSILCMCDSNNIPKYLEVSLKGRSVGDSFRVKDIKFPETVTPVTKDLNATIATLTGRGKAKMSEDGAESSDAQESEEQ